MGLSVGDRVGPYEVLAPLGEGGMGSVWRARDPRLDRDVAIKVMPDAVSLDSERLSRFARESKILAALNHPHIATILGVEEMGAGHAIVMELVAGPTLAERLEQGPLTVREALAIARDVAGALAAAHDRGIVHRDLKPANLKLTDDDRVKVLDFGLAKSVDAAAAAATGSSSVGTTETGVLLGTAAYMSPEQARGAAVDRRADVWSFGCVLYEMLTGRRTFQGSSVADVLAAVMTLDPDWMALPPETPPAVARLLRRCLRREARLRLRDMGDVQLVLDDELAGREIQTPSAAVVAPGRSGVRAGWVVLAAAAAVATAYAVGSRAARPFGEPPLRKLEVAIHDPVMDIFARPRVSPDGRAIVYAATDRLWVRRLDRLEPREVAGSRHAEAPFWSADGGSVAFASGRKLWRIALDGTEPLAICDLPGSGRIISGAWRDDDVIVFAGWQDSMYEVPARGGDPSRLLAVDTAVEVDFHEVTALPRGRGLLFVRHDRVGELQHIEILANGRRSILLRAQAEARFDNPRFDPSGHIVYERLDTNAGIWAVPFSLETLTLTGEPFRVAPGATMPSVSNDGTLVYAEESLSYELAWVERGGERVERVGSPQPDMRFPALSPDGRRVMVAASDAARVQDLDLWMIDTATGRRTRLQPGPTPTRDGLATWAPDGHGVVFVQARRDPQMLVFARVDGGELTDVAPASGRATFSPDGRSLVFPRSEGDRSDLWRIEVGASGFSAARVFLRDGARNTAPSFSPDGLFVAYASDAAGEIDVYIREVSAAGQRWRVTTDGGSSPIWCATGHIFYRDPDGSILAVPVSTRPSVVVGNPVKVLDEAATGAITSRGFEASRDGRRFLVVRRSAAEHDVHLVVVERWLSEFER